jgi:hypothetical protein
MKTSARNVETILRAAAGTERHQNCLETTMRTAGVWQCSEK